MNNDYDPCEWCVTTKEQCKQCPLYDQELDSLIEEVSKRNHEPAKATDHITLSERGAEIFNNKC